MTLPGPDVTHRWQGRTLVDHHGEPLGTIEIIYLDKATEQPEWALLEADGPGPARTFVPLVSASEEGDTIRVPFDKTLVGGGAIGAGRPGTVRGPGGRAVPPLRGPLLPGRLAKRPSRRRTRARRTGSGGWWISAC